MFGFFHLMFSRFFCVVAHISTSFFFWPNNVPLHTHTLTHESGIAKMYSKVAAPFHVEGFCFFTFLNQHLLLSTFLIIAIPSGYEVVFHCGCNLCFLMANDIDLSHVPIGHSCIFFGKTLFLKLNVVWWFCCLECYCLAELSSFIWC